MTVDSSIADQINTSHLQVLVEIVLRGDPRGHYVADNLNQS